MLKRISVLIVAVLSLCLTGCISGVVGLNQYVDTKGGYEFLYPNGWIPVEVADGPDVVLHDIINETENVSVVISPVSGEKQLQDLGTPTEVGYLMQKNAIAPENSGRTAELVNAGSFETDKNTYYLLEYEVTLPNQKRHDFASVAISRGKLFTFNASSTERRWKKIGQGLTQSVKSFRVY